MVKQYKIDAVDTLVQKLDEKGNFILTNYSGVKVKDLGDLRRKLREKDAEYKVVKNNLFKLALNKKGLSDFDDYLKGPIAVAFTADQIGDVAKVLKEFGNDQKSFSFSYGFVDNTLYNEDQVKKIADLPSKEVLLSQVLSLVNGPGTGVAMGMTQIMSSLARGINAVAEAQNN